MIHNFKFLTYFKQKYLRLITVYYWLKDIKHLNFKNKKKTFKKYQVGF